MSKIIFSVLIAFIISSIIGPFLIPVLHRLKFGQNIREDGPQSHMKKAGTPTMGAFIFIISTIITMLLLMRSYTGEAVIAVYAFVAFGVIGGIDDALKIIRKKNEGLKAYQKMVLLLIVSSILAYYAANNSSIGTSIIIPFMKAGANTIDLGIFYIPFIIFYFVATTNGVNLTDGLDGLATSVSLLVLTFLALVSFALGNYEIALFSAIVAGSLLGFLRFNLFPAKIFMGILVL